MTSNGFASPASTSLDELVGLRRQASALVQKSRRKSSEPVSGAHVAKRLGRGLDFAEVREYQPGDDVRMIDWKVTARSGKAHTKLFIEERERPVVLVVDFRAGMRFGTRGMFKSVLAARLAAILGWSAVARHDRVGGFVFTDDWHTEVRARSGRRSLMNLFRGIHQAQLHAPDAERHQLAESFNRLRRTVHAGSTLVLLSDFAGFDSEARSALGGLLHRVDMIAVHIVDPLEYQLPQKGEYRLRSMAQAHNSGSADGLLINTNGARTPYIEHFLAHQHTLSRFFDGHGHLRQTARTDKPLMETAGLLLDRTPESRDIRRVLELDPVV